MVPKTCRRDGQVTVVSCDNNNLYHQKLTKADRDKAKAEEIDLMALSIKSTSTSILSTANTKLSKDLPRVDVLVLLLHKAMRSIFSLFNHWW